MKSHIIELEISSPDELQRKLAECFAGKGQPCFVDLSVFGSDILVRQFDVPRLGANEMVNALKLEAVEILSVAAHDIELNYEIIDQTPERVKGIFIAMPAKKLSGYMDCFAASDFIPVRITARSISVLTKFLDENQGAIENNFCFLHFSGKDAISMAVFSCGKCEFVREVFYDDLVDAERAVMDSLKYSFGKTDAKHLNKLYFSGDLPGKEELIGRLQKKIEIESSLEGDESCFFRSSHAPFSRLNLFKKFSYILMLREAGLKAGKALMVAGGILCLILLLKLIGDARSVAALRGSIDPDDYAHAIKLQQKIGGQQ